MITRALSSAAASLAVTGGLFYMMQLLVATAEDIVVEQRPRHILDWISPDHPPDTPVEPRPPTRPDEPHLPPRIEFADVRGDQSVPVGPSAPPPAPTTQRPELTGFGVGDGPLVNIIKVQPQYPAAAAAKDLAGIVVVQFDVTADGLVENVVVVHSTNRVFNEPAMEAAYRFKYRPRVVDGIPYGATGLRQQFRFQMEN